MRTSKILKIVLLVFVLPVTELVAQVPYMQPGQVPLLLNPSLAGSKRKDRIAAAGQFMQNDFGKVSRTYISYDKLVNKIGSGIGIWVAYQNSWQDPASQLYRERIGSLPEFNENYAQTEIGASIAPKYNIPYKHSREVRFSLSPGLFVAYEKGRFVEDHSFQIVNYKKYNDENPDGFSYATDSTRYIHTDLNSNKLKLGLSFMANSRSFVFLYKITYEADFVRDNTQFRLVEGTTVSIHPVQTNSNIYSLCHTIFAGKTFPENPTSSISVTPFAGFGTVHFLNKPDLPENPDRNVYYSPWLYSEVQRFNYLHTSVNVRLSKFVLGAGFNGFDNKRYGFTSLGFQNDHFKIISTLAFAAKRDDRHIMPELTANYLF